MEYYPEEAISLVFLAGAMAKGGERSKIVETVPCREMKLRFSCDMPLFDKARMKGGKDIVLLAA